MTNIKGKIFVLGDNIDTDQIIPAHHLVYDLHDPEKGKLYGKYALSGVPKEKSGLPQGGIKFIKNDQYISEFSLIIAGKNFGCGSSREHAPFALARAGIKAVVAESYARIFFRNCVDGGYLIPYETPQRLILSLKTYDTIEIDVHRDNLHHVESGTDYKLHPLGEVRDILSCGGIFQYARNHHIVGNE
ncbi:MAG: 3-isopropylmalate dehydratase [bacterium]